MAKRSLVHGIIRGHTGRIRSVRINIEGVVDFHAQGASGNDATLCGVSEEVDSTVGIKEVTPSTRRINCEQCKQIIRHVKSIPLEDVRG